MTKTQLLRLLEDVEDDVQIRFMSQPSWPFEYSIAGIWRPEPESKACTECGDAREDHGEFEAEIPGSHDFEESDRGYSPNDAEASQVVYLVEGSQLAYGTKQAWEDVEHAW